MTWKVIIQEQKVVFILWELRQKILYSMNISM